MEPANHSHGSQSVQHEPLIVMYVLFVHKTYEIQTTYYANWNSDFTWVEINVCSLIKLFIAIIDRNS